MLLFGRSAFSTLTPAQRSRLHTLIPADDQLLPETGVRARPASHSARSRQAAPSRLKGDGLMQSSVLDYFRGRDFDGIAVTLTFRRAQRRATPAPFA